MTIKVVHYASHLNTKKNESVKRFEHEIFSYYIYIFIYFHYKLLDPNIQILHKIIYFCYDTNFIKASTSHSIVIPS